MSLDQYLERLEALQVDLNREMFNQGAGLVYDEARMATLSADIERLGRFLPQGTVLSDPGEAQRLALSSFFSPVCTIVTGRGLRERRCGASNSS